MPALCLDMCEQKGLKLIEKDTENDEISDWGIECKSDIFSKF